MSAQAEPMSGAVCILIPVVRLHYPHAMMSRKEPGSGPRSRCSVAVVTTHVLLRNQGNNVLTNLHGTC